MADAFQKQCWTPTGQPIAGSILIVEDDERLMQCLARAMEARGFKVMTAGSVCDGLAQIQLSAPEYAVVDLRFGDGCGLDVVAALKQQRPDARAIILTGYGNIATAVKAVKLGAVDYLTKPVDADDIVSALLAPLGGKAEAPQHPMSPANVRLQHPASSRGQRTRRVGGGAPPQYASANIAADSDQTRWKEGIAVRGV
jgi:two-component system, response regulator RegA